MREGLARPRRSWIGYTVGFDRFAAYLRGDATTAWPRTPSGPRRSPASPRRASARWRAEMAARADAGHRQLVAAARPSTASSRCGWAWCWRRCSARSGCPAAASATATARSATSATPARQVPVPRLPQGAQPGRDLHPGGPHRRHAAESRRGLRLQRPAPDLSGHPARLLGGGNPFHHHQDLDPAARGVRAARTPSSCTTRSGRRPRATPTSCCRSTMTLERDDYRRGPQRPAVLRDAPR